MTNNKLKIVHLGIAGFPHSVTLAPVQRSYLIYKGLVEAGADVLYINTIPQASSSDTFSDAAQGSLNGIDYVYTSGSPYRSSKFLLRNLTKLKGLINEARLLYGLYRQKKLDVAILYTSQFWVLLYYRCWSKLLGFPIVMNYVEYRSSFKTTDTNNRLSWFLTDRFAPKLVDGLLPISDFLMKHAQERSNAPCLKVPTLCDFSRYASFSQNNDTQYFLYCGSAAYYEVIKFIIDSFEQVNAPNVFLYLIVNGWPHQKEKVNERIRQSGKSKLIKTFSDVPNEDYARLLFQAHGLLIPLRPSVQDTARFPNKVGEYVASGNPVVTTRVGEMASYFRDNVNAYVAEHYDIKCFAQKMQELINFPNQAKKIGAEGQQVGYTQFDYRINGKRIFDFLLTVSNTTTAKKYRASLSD